jgi:signal transduction histidine kinase
MEGYDSDWSRWSTEAQKDYTQIREGSYTFMVRARDVTGIITEASVLPVRILPPWYRSIWAYLLYVGLISGLVYMAHIIRVRRILEVQNIRNRIASDLHDEVSATLSSISFFAEAIDRNKGKQEQGNERFLDLITKSAGEAKEKITDIIWSINPDNDDWVNLLSKCRRFASDLLESKGISYNLDMVSDIPEKMNIELRQHFWLIFKELVTNAVRHSDATHVNISFRYTSGKILIVVSDDGKGFNPDDIKEGNGLRNIRKRSDKIGAVLTFSSSSAGTEWKLEYTF